MIQKKAALTSKDWGISNLNPMRRAFGPGPSNKTCRSCCYFTARNKLNLCSLTTETENPHQGKWKSCSKHKTKSYISKGI
jgi:hypothetical protein